MAKQLNVNLAFTADSRAAKAQIQDLQNSLTKLVNVTANTTSNFGLTKDLNEAIVRANELKIILEKSTNASGFLDLGTFNSELKKSGLKLSDYANSLNSLGVEGQQAFANIAMSVTQAGVPLKKTNALLNEFTTTLKNTARWQISSSILHGFMGAIQSAHGYAQDLNASLNDIRIVTGASVDQMANFAKEANNAAKSLSTTTTEYTNASLIFYQQGLSDQQVKERTNITIKMANAAGQSAQIISDQLTAVWNNFYEEGGKSLEYYADVMTALGAATASSTDEIAGGLEKFAAIADTIGLSYEYAASALATITSNTRQSEEVVGTALKTIFARLQGLNLGETLEDGTNLNKYSEALKKIGVDALDASGELRKADDILTDMAARWEDLSKAEQVAVAQAVGGVRQYNQIVALMDNWDNGDSDSMMANLQTAYGSSGTLQEQADIYAESWEAARDRVTAAAEAIYADLMDEDFFITALNGVEKLLNAVEGLIDGLGGLPGILLTLGSIATNVFGDEIANGLSNMLYNLTYNTETARQEIESLRQDAISAMKSLGDDSISGSAAIDVFNQQASLQDQLLLKQKELEQSGTTLTEQEQKKAQLMMDTASRLGEQVLETSKLREAQESVTQELIEQLKYEGNSKVSNIHAKVDNIKKLQVTYATLSPTILKANEAMKKINSTEDEEKKKTAILDLLQSLQQFKQGADNIGFSFDILSEDAQKFLQSLNNIDTVTPDQLINGLKILQDDLHAINVDAKNAMTELSKVLSGEGVDESRIRAIMTELSNSFLKTGRLTADQIQQFKNLGIVVDEAGNIISQFSGKTANFADGIMALSSQLMAVASSINAIKNLGSIWSDSDTTTGEKILSTITTLAVAIPTLTSAFNKQNLAKLQGLSIDGLTITKTIAKIAGVSAETIATEKSTAALWKKIAAQMLSNWYYAAAVAVILVLIGVIASLTKEYNKDAEAAKKAAETAEQLAESSEKAKQQLENIKNGFEAYDTAVEKLNSCIKGTDEWNAALKEVNDTVLSLLETYPELLGQKDLFTRNSEGVLEIDSQKRDEIIKDAERYADAAQAAALVSQAEAAEANAISQNTSISRSIGTIYSYDDQGYVDASINAGKIMTDNKELLSGLTPEEFEKELRNLIVKPAGMLDSEYENMISNLMNYQSSINDLATATENAATQMNNATLLLANNYLQDQGYGATETAAAAKAYEKEQDRIYDEIISQDARNNAQIDTQTQTAIDIWDRFQAATGITYELASNAIQGDDNNRVYAYRDEKGKEQTYSIEYIAQTIAAAEAMAAMGTAAQDAANLLGQLSEQGTSFAAALGSGTDEASMANFLSDMTQEQLDIIGKSIAVNDDGSFSIDESGLAALGVTAAQFEQLASTFGISVQDLTANLASAHEKVSVTLTSSDKRYFSDLGINTSNMTVGEQKEFINNRDSFSKNLIDAGSYANAYGIIKENADVDPTNISAFMEAVGQVDLNAEGASEKIAKLADEYGIQGQSVQGLIERVEALDQTYNISTSTIAEQAKTLKDIVGEGLETGDIISQENINKLEEAGINTDSYFSLMADGTYSLTGSAEEFNAIVNNITFDALKQQLQDFDTAKQQALENIESSYLSQEQASSMLLDTSYSGTGSMTGSFGANAQYAATDLGQARLDYINSFEAGSFDFNTVQLELLQSYQTNPELALTEEQLQMVADMIEIVNNKEDELSTQSLMTANSLSELDAKVGELGEVSIFAYGEALSNLASQYENCKDENQRFQKALSSGNKKQVEAARGALEASVRAGELAKQYNLDAEAIERYADELKASGKYSNATDKALVEMAKDQMRFDKAVVSASENMKTWEKDLAVAAETGHLVSETAEQMAAAYGDLLDIDGSQLSADFLNNAENLELMKQALEGNQEAYQQLQEAAGKDILARIGIDTSQWDADLAAIEAKVMEVEGMGLADIEAGASLDDSGFLAALTDMVNAAGMTAQEATDYLSSMGVDAEVINKPEEVEEIQGYNLVAKTGTKPVSYIGAASDGTPMNLQASYPYVEYTTEPVKTTKTVAGTALEVTSASKSSGGNVKHSGSTTAHGGSNAPKKPDGGGGGGSSKSNPAKPTKKSDVVQRYKEVEDKLDDVREEADKTRDSLDKLYGAEHEAAIQRLLELEQQEIDLLKEKEQEAQNYLQEDLKELKTVSAEVDVEFKFDDKGNIENYEEEMTELYEELAEIQRKAGDEWDENEQKEIDALNEKIQKLEEAMAAYEETRELLEDINAELDAFKGKPALPLITSDTLDIYWEINDALDDIDEQIKDLERKAEGLSGEEKLKVLEEINRLEQERVAILQQQAEINQKDIEEKRAALDKLAELNGLQFEYDENGNIANYQEQMGILQAQLDELHAKKAADGLSSAEEEAMNSIIAKMQELADLAGDYRDAVEESEDILNEIEDTLSGIVADPFVRSDFVDIFKETNDQLDDIDRKISKLQNEADKLTGEARRKKLNEIVTLERKRVEILEHQALIAKTEMEDRKRAMEEIAARQELMFEYDENQNITNYQEQLDVLIDKYEKAYNEALGDDGLIDATEQAILDSISDDIDHLEEFIQAYCDAVDQLEDIEDEREELANGGYVDMSQLDDIADELHDINQSLDDLQELLDDSARAADRLYGEARIKQMEKNASLLQEEIDLLQQKKTAQDDIIAKEKQQLDEKTGGYIKYDEYGRITNYDSYINAREDQIKEYEAALQEGGLSETEATLLQDEIDLLNEQIAAMEDYEQALEEKEDIQNQIEDAYYEWQDLNAEKLQYKLELQLDVNDRELAKIERAIKRLDGNFYSRAEALALMVGGGMNGDSKLGNYNKQLADLEAHYQEVKRQYEAGEISQAKYVEMTKQLQAEIESTADAMAALQDQMDSYYKDTLAQARQELNFHISQLTHLTGILNHFKNTLTALGKSKDYEMMGTVLEGQVQALENEVKASKNAMQMWQKEADSIYQKYQQALSSGNQENADMYYNAYKEALSAANEAENKFYQQSAAWANALKALMENTLAGLAQDLENALTGGTSFDTITTQMKRASSLQEEYLTTTNKIYETTKLMRTAQQEIDKTTNSVAKQKLSQFITETKQMQNQNKLSKYELSIQQAKYDLLVAEIALEEARFAKSTVRLRRDSEGNFGYIYTADAEAIATAEQKFEDAQNKLYNIGLDGANKYTEKYQQTLAEMYNTLTSLQTKYLQGGFESEAEYNAAVLEAKEYYYEKLNQYSELYSVAINAESGTLTDTLVNNSGIVTDALTKNSRIAADAWSTDFADMTTKTDQWMVAVTDYLSQVQNAFADWEVESQRIANETVGTDLTTLKNKVSDIVTESDNLTAAIGDENSGVIKAIYDEITAVSGLVDQYANLNGQLTDAIQNAYDLSDALQQDIDQAGQDENPPGQYAPGEEESQKPGTVVPEGTDPMDPIETPQDPPHEHYYVKSKTSPTCTEKGYTTYTCSCGDTYDGDYVDALGHNYTSKVIEEATYERGNLIRYTCQRCGDTYEEYDDNKLPKPKEEGSGEVTKPVEPIKPEPTKPAEPVEPNNSDKIEGVAASIWMDGSDVSGWGTGNTRKNRLKEKGVSKAQDYINKHAENGDIYAAWHNKRSQLKQYYYGKFDTGGYTGAWGPEGKWAMLHEKEIVLNKEDTKNFLASLELLDNILSTIDLHAMNSQWTPYLASPGISNIGKEALEQMVNIEASFPNATDKHEIEEAFKDLVNLASQYANRK